MMYRLSEHAKSCFKETGVNPDKNFDGIFEQFKKSVGDVFGLKKYSLSKCLELAKGLMDFTIHFYQNNKEKIEQILEIILSLINQNNKENNED